MSENFLNAPNSKDYDFIKNLEKGQIFYEIIRPIREMRSEQSKEVSKKGQSNHRWIVGRKINDVINERCDIEKRHHATQNVCDNTFDDNIEKVNSIVLSDGNYKKRNGETPLNMKICKKGSWNERMRVETLFFIMNEKVQY